MVANARENGVDCSIGDVTGPDRLAPQLIETSRWNLIDLASSLLAANSLCRKREKRTMRAMLSSSINEKLFLKALERIRYGTLQLTLPNGAIRRFTGLEPGPQARLKMVDRAMIGAVLSGGDIGFGESYMRGEWETDDLCSVMHVAAANADSLGIVDGRGMKRFLSWIYHHFLRRDTLAGSRRNVYEHYDLSNDFYRLWLDESMTYTGAYFARDDMTLEEAQAAKYGRILQRLGASHGAHVLDIGCGWGAFVAAAARLGMRATGINISREQISYANEWLRRESVENAEIVLRDYREERGRYDHIVSIEMIDHVSERSWPGYFDTLKRSLNPNGKTLLQSIIITDSVFDEYRKGCDFLQRHIFPGAMLPSDAALRACAAGAGLKVTDAFEFGRSYARTAMEWLTRFDAASLRIRAMGFPSEFMRKWRFYLAYCYGGLMSGRSKVVQYELMHA
jgi:cyclopropane-fatty-acyl-phospholipid synthase